MAMDNAAFTAQDLLLTEDVTTDVYIFSGYENISDSDQLVFRNFQFFNVSVRLLMGLLAISGNLLTVVAIGRYEYLRSSTSYLIAALAIGDMMGGFNCVMVLINYLTPMTDETWLNMCAVEVNLSNASAGLNLSYILFISVDRFIFITFPLRYHSLVTPRLIVAAIVLPIVLIAIHLTAMLFAVEEFENMPGRICSSVYPKHVRASLSIWFYVCMPCTVFIHTRIGWIAYRQRRAMEQAQSVAATQEHKITKMLLLVLGVYVACYVPQITVLAMREYMAPDNFIIIDRMTSWIWWINAWANPFIYAWKSKDFNRAFRSLLRLRKPTVDPALG